MRIISGKFKGRQIKVPKSKFVRPTTDRVRETLFNILNNRIEFNETTVLDIYAGSGSLGFESLSRGASMVHFVENNFVIYKNLLENINKLNAADFCKIFRSEAIKFSKQNNPVKYDLILADPPFFKDDIYEVTENLISNKFLNDEGLLVIERSVQTKEKDINNFKVTPFKIIGDTCFYEISYKKA